MNAWALLSREAADAVLATLSDLPHARLPDGSMLLDLGVEFTPRPAALHRALIRRIGGIVSAHEDERGVLVFEQRPPPAAAYSAVVGAVGVASLWLPLPRKRTNTLGAHAVADLSTLSEVPASAARFVSALAALVDQPLELATPDPEDLVLLVRGFAGSSAPVGHPDSGTRELLMLPDGTAVLRTMWHVAGRDELEFVLAEWHHDWLRHHDDPRGVPSFSAASLELVRAARGYEEALARVGDAVEYLTPRRLAEVTRPAPAWVLDLLKTR